MYDRKVTLSLTEDEWRALCANAKSADRTPKLQARHLVRAALGLTDKAERKNESGAERVQATAAAP